MEYRRFGGTDLKVSAIGLGCWEIGGTYGRVDETSSPMLCRRRSTTASPVSTPPRRTEWGYRKRRWRERSDIAAPKSRSSRNSASATKKRRTAAARRVVASIDKSLRRLQTDHVDAYLVHWPDPNTPLAETTESLDDIVRQGKARYVGVSNFRLEQIEEAMRVRRVDVVQYAWNMFDRRMQIEIFPYCAAQQIGVMAYGSLAYGMLSGTFHAGMSFNENDWRSKGGMLGSLNLFKTLFGSEHFPRNLSAVAELKRLAAKYDNTLPQFALRWTLGNPVVGTALVGFRTPAEVSENLGALGWEIGGADMAEVDAILAHHGAVTEPPGWLED